MAAGSGAAGLRSRPGWERACGCVRREDGDGHGDGDGDGDAAGELCAAELCWLLAEREGKAEERCR